MPPSQSDLELVVPCIGLAIIVIFLYMLYRLVRAVVWVVYKAWTWLTGNQDDGDKRTSPYRHRRYGDSRVNNAEPERDARYAAAFNLPEKQSRSEGRAEERNGDKAFTDGFQANSRRDQGYRSANVGPERFHEFRVRFNAEQERYASELAIRREVCQLLRHLLYLDTRVQHVGGPVYVNPESRSNLARRSVVPRGFENLPLTEQLKMYHNRVKLGDEDTKHAKELVETLIGAIVHSVKEQLDAGRPQRANRCRIEHTGSMYEGTKFGRPDEFDLMIVIDGSQDIESEEITPGYARLRANSFTSHRFSKCLDRYQNISPKRMIDWCTGLVQKGVNEVSKQGWGPELKLSRHGPAVMVNIKEKNGVSIDVDLVLCVQLSQQRYFVAKPFKEYAEEPDRRLTCDPDMLWRRSFSVFETRTIASIDGANECRRDCLRILKSIFRAEPGLDKFTSFHLKTVLLLMCQDEKQWQSSRMGERFLDLLRRIEGCLRDEYLPHFYLPDLNLLDGIRSETIENMRGRVGNLINNTHERNRILHVR